MRYLHKSTAAIFLIIISCHSMEQDHQLDTHSVSFVYYPTGRDFPLGHAEVEVDGNSWTLVTDRSYGSRPLKEMIDKSTDDGFPFFRFILEAEQQQIEKLKKSIEHKRWAINCTRAALRPLSEANICSVPLPFNISPLLTGLYLATGKKLKLNGVRRIEYYGNPSLKESCIKMCLGSIYEAIFTGVGCVGLWTFWELGNLIINAPYEKV